MHCTNCGKALPEGSRFCTGCGTAICPSAVGMSDTPPVPASAAKKTRKPLGRKRVWILLAAAVVLAGLVVGAVLLFGGRGSVAYESIRYDALPDTASLARELGLGGGDVRHNWLTVSPDGERFIGSFRYLAQSFFVYDAKTDTCTLLPLPDELLREVGEFVLATKDTLSVDDPMLAANAYFSVSLHDASWQWSPDGTRVLAAPMNLGRLLLFDLTDNSARMLFPAVIRYAAFTEDGNVLYLDQNSDMGVLDWDAPEYGGKMLHTYDAVGEIRSFSAAPGGKAVAVCADKPEMDMPHIYHHYRLALLDANGDVLAESARLRLDSTNTYLRTGGSTGMLVCCNTSSIQTQATGVAFTVFPLNDVDGALDTLIFIPSMRADKAERVDAEELLDELAELKPREDRAVIVLQAELSPDGKTALLQCINLADPEGAGEGFLRFMLLDTQTLKLTPLDTPDELTGIMSIARLFDWQGGGAMLAMREGVGVDRYALR